METGDVMDLQFKYYTMFTNSLVCWKPVPSLILFVRWGLAKPCIYLFAIDAKRVGIFLFPFQLSWDSWLMHILFLFYYRSITFWVTADNFCIADSAIGGSPVFWAQNCKNRRLASFMQFPKTTINDLIQAYSCKLYTYYCNFLSIACNYVHFISIY